jgi:5-methylcytosine-specific restriction endonuclease McrA
MGSKKQDEQDKQSQRDLVFEYFKAHPLRDIEQSEVTAWAIDEYFKREGKRFADPHRAVRKLHELEILIKVKKGVYRYDPDLKSEKTLWDFPAKIKKQIFERDGYRCVVCGNGPEEGVEIHADHKKPKILGGEGTLENGRTLCAKHNYMKKNYSQTESGKRMFIDILETAREVGDEQTAAFCKDILAMYEKHNINGHIEWK